MKRLLGVLMLCAGLLFFVGGVQAQPGHGDVEALEQIIREIGGDDFNGHPCSLTQEQRDEIDQRVLDELGIELGFGDFPCDDDHGKQGGGDRGKGKGNGDGRGDDNGRGPGHGGGDSVGMAIKNIISEIVGQDFRGGPCDLTAEQRAEIDARVLEELGIDLGFSMIPCDSIPRWEDSTRGGGTGGGIDPHVLRERLHEIVLDVAGDDFSGDPCDLTQEQIDEINARLAEEFGDDAVIEIHCDNKVRRWHGVIGRGHGLHDGHHGRGHGDRFGDGSGLFLIISDVAGEDFSGNPCDLTQEQREEIDRRAIEELGIDPGFSKIPCDAIGNGRGDDHGNGGGNGGDINPNDVRQRLLEIIVEVAGEDFSGNPCDLTEEQIAEINARLAEEFGDKCPVQIGCDQDDRGNGGSNGGDIDFGDVDVDRLMEIVIGVAGENFTGDPCDLTQEQREEIDRLILEEFGVDLGLSDLPCNMGMAQGGVNTQGSELVTLAAAKRASTTISGAAVAPNPAQGRTTLRFTSAGGSGVIRVINSRGEVINQEAVSVSSGANNVDVDLSDVPAGAYFITVEVNGSAATVLPVSVQ